MAVGFWSSIIHCTTGCLNKLNFMQYIHFDSQKPSACKVTERCVSIRTGDTQVFFRGSIYDLSLDSVSFSDHDLEENINFLRSINGEYSIIIDSPEYTLFATDHMATRDLHFYLSTELKHLVVGTLRKNVMEGGSKGAWRCMRDQIYVVHKDTFKLDIHQNKHWDLKQSVNNYDRVYEAFELACKNRFTSPKDKLLLSGGMDSGAIACSLAKLGLRKFTLAHIKPPETKKMSGDEISCLIHRFKHHKGQILPKFNPTEWDAVMHELNKYDYIERYLNPPYDWLVALHAQCVKKVAPDTVGFISGQDADNLYCDQGMNYKKYRPKSFFGGYFPEQLEIVFPWYTNMNLWLNDLTHNYFELEHRLPFIDADLMQAWFNTSVDLKNRSRKDWIKQYLSDHQYGYYDDWEKFYERFEGNV